MTDMLDAPIPPKKTRTKQNGPKRINLALQGGGSHGAFTWGVLDRLLEDDRLEIDGISGTSAGAMNAAALAQGYVDGGREGARASLNQFWGRISDFSRYSPVQRSLMDRLMGNWNLDTSPGYLLLDTIGRAFSPYQTNPLNWHPIRTVLEEEIDIARIRRCKNLNLFVSATNVRTGKIRVFDRKDLSIDALLASACLPTVFQAIEIDGDPYWDGGYMGNPAIFPLIYGCESQDVVIVQINPVEREGTPQTTSEILNRLNEITFNSTLMRELRAIAFVQRLIHQDMLHGDHVSRLKVMHIHLISAEEHMKEFGASSKMNADPEFLHYLKELGRAQADRWLGETYDKIGKQTSIDIKGYL
ncbi:alpha/beta hydrolase [Aliidongia dinghuensis]|uniref:Alpha/beta hydrolase n=1 Tax=Aliidongia dinghuensis TaxID=1867774 RepID=A0A8J3E5N4_9PROT|nr:patatin-like phospholipase family protein [Aliidongia dinghuensis]GGF48978.1 alpha/beta hydrolase [Aliidongia dinghuensis]